MRIEGAALAYPQADDVNTDVIWPGKYTYVQIPYEEMPAHAMETFDPEFATKVAGKSVLVVGKNFGCGSSREQASECLGASGVRLIVARSFARIFYRNAFNMGLPIFESADAFDGIEEGDEVEVDADQGVVRNLTKGVEFQVAPIPPFMQELIADGGLMAHIAKKARHESS